MDGITATEALMNFHPIRRYLEFRKTRFLVDITSTYLEYSNFKQAQVLRFYDHPILI
jgi:hypothetical protein